MKEPTKVRLIRQCIEWMEIGLLAIFFIEGLAEHCYKKIRGLKDEKTKRPSIKQ